MIASLQLRCFSAGLALVSQPVVVFLFGIGKVNAQRVLERCNISRIVLSGTTLGTFIGLAADNSAKVPLAFPAAWK